jgi:uncharacterized protein YfeS
VETLDDAWELSPETAHPNAARLLKEPFFWDIRDENSPFGNESGSAALEFFRAAIDADPDLDSSEFLADLLEEWDVDGGSAEGVPDEDLNRYLEREHFHILTYDDAVVAVAFAEVVFRGTASIEIVEAASKALERQCLPIILEFRGWSDPSERRARCEEMIGALGRA